MRFIATVLMLLIALQTQAGLISTIIKAGKKVDADLPDLHHLDLDLPKGMEGSPLRLDQDVNGVWWVKMPDGNKIPSFDLAGIKRAGVEKPLLVIDSFNLPKNINALGILPDGVPVLIKNNSQLFKLESGDGFYLHKGLIRVKVDSSSDVESAIWHLNRRFSPDKVYRIGMGDVAIPGGVKSGGIDPGLDVGLADLLNTPEKFRLKTVAVAGEIKEGAMYLAGQWVPVKRLTELAAEQDISLLVVPVKSAAAAKKLGEKLDQRNIISEKASEQSTEDFFASFISPNVTTDISINPSGQSQVVIAQVPANKVNKTGDAGSADLTELPTNIALGGLKLYRPDQVRAEEMDKRLHPWIPSWVPMYLFFSFILACVQPRFTWWALGHLWRTPVRENYTHWFKFYAVRWSRAIFFLAFLFPLLGVFCFVLNGLMIAYAVIKKILLFLWGVINFLLIRPFLFIKGFISK